MLELRIMYIMSYQGRVIELLQGLNARWTIHFGPHSCLATWSFTFMQLMGIGVLARQAGVGIDTVRYYERSGLLEPDERSAAGYRRYSPLALQRLRFIRRAQALGFSLAEIRELLALSRQRDVARVKKSAEAKLKDVEARMAELDKVRAGLARLVSACPGHGRVSECPILLALGGPDHA